MVERLKHAIEKARAQREAEELAQPAARVRASAAALRAPGAAAAAPARAAPGAPAPRQTSRDELWASLREIEPSEATLESSRIVTRGKSDPAHIPFDLLRTRMLRVFRDNGWSRVAITSPRKGCGKTLVSVNLALSLARQAEVRTILVDMDLKAPAVAATLGVRNAPHIAWFLAGRSPLETALVRYGPNLAIALNGERVRDSAELIHDDETRRVIGSMMERMKPDIAIFDLPPMMVGDDAIAFLPLVDCVILVAAAGETTAKEIEDCEAMFGGQTNFLGVVLNKAERGAAQEGYAYYK